MTSGQFDRLAAEIGKPTVYDVVPIEERSRYRFWRGLSLAAVAVNITSDRTIALDLEPVHFAPTHLYAANVAQGIASGQNKWQVRGRHDEISAAIGVPFTQDMPHPSLVVACTDVEPDRIYANAGNPYASGSGVRIKPMLEDLDPHSHEFLADYFNLY